MGSFIEGRISKVFSVRGNWCSGVMRCNGSNVKFCGSVSRHPYVGMWIEGEACLEHNTNYGDQWVPVSYFAVRVVDRQSYMALMGSGEFAFVNYSVANRVWNFVKGNLKSLLHYLQTDTILLMTKCGLTDDHITDFFRALVVDDQYKRLMQLFPHLTIHAAKNLLTHSGLKLDLIIQFLRMNPYQFIHIKGVWLEDLDKVAVQDNGVPLDDKYRMYYLIWYTLKKFMDGYGCTYLNLSNRDECYCMDKHYYYSKGSFLQRLHSYENMPVSDSVNEPWLRRLFVHFQSSKFKIDIPLLHFEQVTVEQELENNSVLFSEIHLYTKDMWNAQRELSEIFTRVCGHDNHNDAFYLQNASKFSSSISGVSLSLSDEQISGVKNVFCNKVSVITGGPGRGKTHLLLGLIPLWEYVHGSGTVMCIGPTGRSVRRMDQVMDELDICCDSQTAARCLVANGYAFDHYVSIPYGTSEIHRVKGFDEFNLSSKALIVIDECSMLDFVLACNLLKLLENATVVFMGDVNQLPPVRSGCFFKQLIDSGIVPVTRLTVNMRANYPEIINNADAIINGSFDMHNRRNFSNNFMFLSASSNQEIQDYVLMWYKSYIGGADADSDHSDVLVMSPVHRGAAGVDGLNCVFQDSINPVAQSSLTAVPDANFGDLPFLQHKGCVCEGFRIRFEEDEFGKKQEVFIRIGDRLMATENDSEIKLRVFEKHDPDREYERDELGLFNGDLGTVKRYYPAASADGLSYVMIQMDDGRCLYIDCDVFVETKMFTLGYAFTIHKAQGSEAKHVILCIPMFCGISASPLNPFLTQNLIYTACTRAKDSVLIIGDEKSFERALHTPAHYHNTELCRLLK